MPGRARPLPVKDLASRARPSASRVGRILAHQTSSRQSLSATAGRTCQCWHPPVRLLLATRPRFLPNGAPSHPGCRTVVSTGCLSMSNCEIRRVGRAGCSVGVGRCLSGASAGGLRRSGRRRRPTRKGVAHACRRTWRTSCRNGQAGAVDVIVSGRPELLDRLEPSRAASRSRRCCARRRGVHGAARRARRA